MVLVLFENCAQDGLETNFGAEGGLGRDGGDDLHAQAILAGMEGFGHIEFKWRHPEGFEFFSIQGHGGHDIHLAQVELH